MRLKTTPEYGTIRTRKVFLWFPKKFLIYEKKGAITKCWGRTETLWFETIEIDEAWTSPSWGESGGFWQMEDYSRHDDIIEHEIIDIVDTQIPQKTVEKSFATTIDPFDLPSFEDE